MAISKQQKTLLKKLAVFCLLIGPVLLVKWFVDSLYFEPTSVAMARAEHAKIWGVLGAVFVVLSPILFLITHFAGPSKQK